MGVDYYGFLEINRSASDDDIKNAYRKLALKYHPKRNDDPKANERFTAIAEAYDVLSSPKFKALYDQFGEDAIKKGVPLPPGPGEAECPVEIYTFHGDPIKVFRDFFGVDSAFANLYLPNFDPNCKFFDGGTSKLEIGPNQEHVFPLSLEEAFHGTTKSIDVPMQVVDESGRRSVRVVKNFTFRVPKGTSYWMDPFRNFTRVLQHNQKIIDEVTSMTNSLFEMETPLEADWRTLSRCGIVTKKDVLRWSVESDLIRYNECSVRSDFFTFGPARNCKFYLVVCSKPCVSYFTVGLCKVRLGGNHTTQDDKPPIKVSFSLLDMRDRCHHTCERIMKDGDDSVQASFDRTCYSTQHQMFLRSGCLVIHCAMDVNEVLAEDSTGSGVKAATHAAELTSDWVADFRSMLDTGLHSDVVLSLGEEEIKAHRAILSARSPVFAAMFEHDTMEKKQNKVVIEDLTKEAMQQLLRFLYTGEMDDLDAQELLSLLVAADKYGLPKLKEKCGSSLCMQIAKEVALNVLVVANMHGDENLKNAAVQVVLDNAIDVMKSPEWLTFLKEYPEIANVIILNLAMKSQKTA